MDNKKKITIAIVTVIAVIAIAIIVFLLTKNTKTLYTISFNTDGGNEVVSQEIEEGNKINKPKDPTKEGYEFLGWYLNGEYFDFETSVEKNMELEARWKEIAKEEKDDEKDVKEDNNEEGNNKVNEEETTKVTKYTVTFNSNGGSKVSSQTVEKNKTAKAPTNPTKSGYTFKGWYLGNSKYSFSKKVTKNITLTAKWEKVEEKEETPSTPSTPETPVTPEVKKYTVTFDTDGGNSISSQTIEDGKTATKPTDPTRSGYTFKGWYHNGTLFNFNTKIAGNVTLVAKWEKNAVITSKIETIASSYVGQVRIFVLKDGVKVAGIVDITLSDGTVVKNVSIPKDGYVTNGYDLKEVSNARVK